MKKLKTLFCFAIGTFVVLGISVVAYATGSVSGTITNTISGTIYGAGVSVIKDNYVIDNYVTDHNGTYSITGLAADTYEIHMVAENYEYRLETGTVVTDGNNTVCDFNNVAAEGKISGKVTKSNGTTAIEGVGVVADCNGGFILTAITDANGNYKIENLPAETYTVTAIDPNHVFPDDANAVVTAGSTTSDVNLIGVNGKISGTITESNGSTPIEDAIVFAKDSNDNVLNGNETNASGDYELKYFGTGTYTVEVRFEGALIASANDVSVTDGSTTDRDFSAAGGSISGTVTDSNQTALQGALLIAVKGNNTYQDISDASGDYKIERLPAGIYEILLDPNDNNNLRSTIKDVNVVANTETSGQDFSLGFDGKISGTVTDSNAAAINCALILAMCQTDSNNVSSAITASNGTYIINCLPAGTYTVYASANNYVSDTDPNIVVTTGQTNSGNDFALGTSSGTISGTVYESDGETPISGAIVVCYSTGNSFAKTISDINGDYSLTLLQSATYQVEAFASGYSAELLTGIVVTAPNENSGNDFTLDTQ